MNFRLTVKKVVSQFKLAIFWFTLVIFLLVAFPSVTLRIPNSSNFFHFDGVDLSELSDNKLPYEFQFSPSFDAYGGSESVYKITLTTPASTTTTTDASATEIVDEQKALQVLASFNQRLKNIGIGEFVTSLHKKSAADWEIDLKTALTGDQLKNVDSLLGLSPKVSFVKAAPADSTTTDSTNQQQQFTNTILTGSDIKNATVTYGASTLGYGLIIEFRETSRESALITGLSDINTNTGSQLYVAVDSQVIGAQRSTLSSNDVNLKMLTATNLGNDKLAAELLADMINNRNNYNYTLTSTQEAIAIPGKFDQYLDQAKLALAVLLLGLGAYAIWRYRQKGLIWFLNVSWILIAAVAAAKVTGLPLSSYGLIGLGFALIVWFVDSRKLFRVLNLTDFSTNLQEARKRLFRFLVLLCAFALILANVNIPILTLFFSYFSLTTLFAVFDYYFALPITRRLSSYAKK